MSDEDLAQISAITRTEDRLFAVGCLGSAVALPLLLLALLIFGGAVQLVFLGSVSALILIFYAHHLLGRSRQHYRQELAYRCGRSAFSRYVEEAQIALGQLQADWIILFTTTGLPHGNHRWLRIDLRDGALASARAELRVSRTPAALSCTRAEVDVPRDVTKRLLSTLQALDLSTLTDVPSTVIDGAPSQVGILRRDPREVKVASCNLASDHGKEVQHPTVQICADLYGIMRQMKKADPAA